MTLNMITVAVIVALVGAEMPVGSTTLCSNQVARASNGITMKCYRIAWRSRTTGATGHGAWHEESDLDMLREMMAAAELKYPELAHWIEEMDGSPPE